ncbi:strG [Symbiodinium natans]|uniref:StrG protein n=1 Tax=Symbiodinium natans TaxID=878477 RepID=A0A812UBH7_9DINO|nr:strG [Symbiodinium natans]
MPAPFDDPQSCGVSKGERLLIAAAAPQILHDLPAALRVQDTVHFDTREYNLREQITALLASTDVGRFPNESEALEDFEAVSTIFRSFPARQRLCEIVTQASDFLAVYERLVLEVLVPWLRNRLEGQVEHVGPTNFSYQYPPTLRIQPGRSKEFKRPHRDAEYGHQIGELNFWMPLTDYSMTEATLWVESSPGAEDFQPLAINHGSIAVFHGTLCRHKVPANTSPFTRVSLDFRIGVGDFFDRDWQLNGVKHVHGVWPGSHIQLRREPALKICDPGCDAAALCREGAALRGYEGLVPCPPDAEAPGQALPLSLRAGDCVILHPHTAHAAAPRYTPSGIRIMVYFRLRAKVVPQREPADESRETCREVFFDLPGVASALGEESWSDFLADGGGTRDKMAKSALLAHADFCELTALLLQQENNRNLQAQVQQLIDHGASARLPECFPRQVFASLHLGQEAPDNNGNWPKHLPILHNSAGMVRVICLRAMYQLSTARMLLISMATYVLLLHPGESEEIKEDPSLQAGFKTDLVSEPCCSRLCGSLACNDSQQLLDPVAQKPFGTDAASLVCSQDGCSENAREICLALSGSPEPRQELSEAQRYALALEDGAVELHTQNAHGLMPARLYVPVNLRQLAYDWSAPSSSQPAISDAEMAELRDCLTTFVEAMLRGVIVQLTIEGNETGEGCNLVAVVALPSSLEDLIITTGGLEQSIRLSCIRWVRPLDKGRRSASWLWANERRKMVHVSLAGGCFLRFRFDQEDQAAFFGTCMRLLAKASYADSLID